MATGARRVFVAGSTGATGQVLVRLARERGVEVVAHRRPRPGRGPDPRSVECDLGDAEALAQAMRGCTTLVQLIGTTRQRFASGDTYESSDVGTTRSLVAAARAAGLDHVVILSSVGAGRPVGAYLQAKAEAERLVRESGLAWTALRPSAFMGDRHHVPAIIDRALRALRIDRWRPIHLHELAAALLQVSIARAPLGVALEGRSLWSVIEAEHAGRP